MSLFQTILYLTSCISEFNKTFINENHHGYNNELRKDIYKNRLLLEQNKTFAEIGDEHNCKRQFVQEVEKKIVKTLKVHFDKVNKDFSELISSELKDKKIILLDETSIKELYPYRNLIKKFMGKENIESRSFVIDTEYNLIYDSMFEVQKAFDNILEQLINNQIYEKDFIISLFLNYLLEIFEEINSEYFSKISFTLANIFIEKYLTIKNLIDISDNNTVKYIYSQKPLNETEYQQKLLSYWFEVCYPEGIDLPQQNPEIGMKNLKPLLEKVPSLATYSNYRYLRDKICNDDEIVTFNNGSYIHFNYYKNLYNSNKQFAEDIIKFLKPLYSDGYNSIKIWSLFKAYNIESKFKKLGIDTHERLFYLLKAANNNEYRFHNIKKGLLITLADIDDKNLVIKYNENKAISTTETAELANYLSSATFKNQTKHIVENKINITTKPQKHNYSTNNQANENQSLSEEVITEEYENIPTSTKEAIIKQRIGQDKLRDLLLTKEKCCQLCGINMPELLIASHIKAWKDCNNTDKIEKNERGSLNNVLLLCATHDKLFDKGYISFDENGEILISKLLSPEIYHLVNINKNITINIKSDLQKQYLEFHRKNIFKQ